MNELQAIEIKPILTRRPTAEGIEPYLGRPIPCLDHGFVYVVDYLGTQEGIVDAARVSYGAGTRKVSTDRGLIRYLMRHRHTTPFEMCEIKLHVKLPIFVARQWIRHRTANVNEYSARYSILTNEFYIPELEHLAVQSKSNRQGRSEQLRAEDGEGVQQLIREHSARSYELYELLLNDDGEGAPVDPGRPQVARELSRMVLPTNGYTEWYWKIDLHNLLHFLSLRADPHAQLEIRIYAEAICRIVEAWVPWVWEAFVDYELEARRFTRLELEIIKRVIELKGLHVPRRELQDLSAEVGMTNTREQGELDGALARLGITIGD
jgi:thymidylate synthase (FAD)